MIQDRLHGPKVLIAAVVILSCDAVSGQDADASPIFARDVAPIISKNCTVCHQPGQSASFGLLSYRDAMRRAKQIVQVTGSRYMPPWAGACSSKTILMSPWSTWAKRCN